ncbi:hypothetical protein AtNW77_Chr5g0141441 [Arabidopsis thaliana]|uniref:KIB1-4 beta-propeller domain-containing protein n=2 Tax=Arabidopsis TaxID=3701 RepID=Q9LDH8_ARATH|nr:hypothetical protein (DUF295) [Arabidopsis thaliana]NP_568831.1 hypothetical protein (DUF295) [Arabidopsis thaliana]KAG7606232.1 hypothetical protein ISN45_At05g051660 [Arabidopsis thaliana x Arabidopsis arenosa]AED96694.1 hypothetical protein (DUF295) [Arabidopsis thaliana]AED96695.1 hypothetical protein (DUF295) [Arabidopsis thaliana]BAA97288.1 unnamed protein product [Arabidopsis thaliana]BAA97289.1 unnamed protein product [Arabidopsis thaliana]|eukprot:NP_568830.1 hypothetical protein (DUF295) [Arabidopsis thaliana]
MSLLLNQPSKLLCFRRKSVLVRSSPLLSNGLSSSLRQTPPCTIIDAVPCGEDLGKLVIYNANAVHFTYLEKKVPLELVDNPMVTIGSSHGWVATLSQDDGILRLQDDLNPAASDTNPKRIPLPPLVTLPHCQTQIVTNVSMSSSSPEDENCVVAVKFLGPQISFCRPAQRNSEWINVRIANPCFYSSRVMFSEKHDLFRIPGSGGHIIASWDLHKDKHKNPKFQRLRFQNLPKLTKTKREVMDSCYKSEHLVESRTTGETFLVKWYRKAVWRGMSKLSTKALMVFRLDDEGNAVYTKDIGDLCIFLSKSEPFCVSLSSLPRMFFPNNVEYMDADEDGYFNLARSSIVGDLTRMGTGVYIPPQNIDN